MSVPIAIVHNPALTAAAEPELEPPGTLSLSHGFLHVGVFELIFKLVRASRIGILLRSDLNLA